MRIPLNPSTREIARNAESCLRTNHHPEVNYVPHSGLDTGRFGELVLIRAVVLMVSWLLSSSLRALRPLCPVQHSWTLMEMAVTAPVTWGHTCLSKVPHQSLVETFPQTYLFANIRIACDLTELPLCPSVGVC